MNKSLCDTNEIVLPHGDNIILNTHIHMCVCVRSEISISFGMFKPLSHQQTKFLLATIIYCTVCHFQCIKAKTRAHLHTEQGIQKETKTEKRRNQAGRQRE